MLLQTIIVTTLVLACAGYSAWALMPSAARRAMAGWALKLGLPKPLARPFRRAVQPQSGCGACGACSTTAAKPIRIHRR